KRVFLPYMQNTVDLMYELVSGADRVELALRPSVNFRAQEAPVSEPLGAPYEFRSSGDESEIVRAGGPFPSLRLRLWAEDPSFTLKPKRIDNVLYPVEESRGYQARGDLWSPGYFAMLLAAREPVNLVASTESFETTNVMAPRQALDAERSRRRRLIAQAVPEARPGVAAE